MYCSRYDKTIEEAVKFSCDVPTDSYDIEEQIEECKDCVFYQNSNEKNRLKG